ncbi:MAG: response regulator [bacterium]|nr:response regulator [bacterium]
MAEKQTKILVAEDEAMMSEIVVRKLSSAGFDVMAAYDGKQALEIWLKGKPDLVLLDLIMPEMDGFDVLKNIRKNSDAKIANTPVIILSNLWSNKDILKAQDLKIQGYLVKAYFTTEEILNKVKDVLAQNGK